MKQKLQSKWNFDCSCELCGNPDAEMRRKIEKHRMLCWQLCKNIHKNRQKPEAARQTVKLCEDLLEQMIYAKYHSVILKMQIGLTATAMIAFGFKLSYSGRKHKLEYFFQLVEENLMTCEGSNDLN